MPSTDPSNRECLLSVMAKTKITVRKSTGGDTPRRQLAHKAGGAPIATAIAARPTVSPYPRRSLLLKLGTTASSEPRTTVSSEPQTGSLLEPSAGASPEPDTHEVSWAKYRITSLPLYLPELALQEYISAPSLGFIEQVYIFTDGIDEHEANVNKWLKQGCRVYYDSCAQHDQRLVRGPEFSALPYDVLTALFPSALRKAFKNRTIYLNFLTRTAQEWCSSKLLTKGSSLEQALPYMLTTTSTSSFVRHTNLLYVRISTSKSKAALSSEFVWTHLKLRPFGCRLPANCAKCGCIDTFGSSIKLTPKAGSKCLHELAVEPMEGFETYGKSQNDS
ncbi:hypothetical protein FIBSPDRAFT_884960 [Athelia psychrophila]|uniref:Uncharacterized protein n=1 Tax=Athelia psychrophila TaxID=1759441 RepID=A0A166SL04_9AGAM|nr:hypothetical protein FIBSPDRAFT_884960 [Fibularhizoctonia sp. CBS 109695]